MSSIAFDASVLWIRAISVSVRRIAGCWRLRAAIPLVPALTPHYRQPRVGFPPRVQPFGAEADD